MTAKQVALSDLQTELEREHKEFISFRKSLNSIMRKLVSKHIKNQLNLNNMYKVPSKNNSQLVAHCMFSKTSGVKFENYSNYYNNKNE